MSEESARTELDGTATCGASGADVCADAGCEDACAGCVAEGGGGGGAGLCTDVVERCAVVVETICVVAGLVVWTDVVGAALDLTLECPNVVVE